MGVMQLKEGTYIGIMAKSNGKEYVPNGLGVMVP